MVGKLTQIIHHQPTLLVPEDSVDSRYGLHKSMTSHRLIQIHGVQTGGIESRKPHIPHDHQLELIAGILESLGEALSGWAGTLTQWAQTGKTVYCYFNNDHLEYAAKNAGRLREMLSQA